MQKGTLYARKICGTQTLYHIVHFSFNPAAGQRPLRKNATVFRCTGTAFSPSLYIDKKQTRE